MWSKWLTGIMCILWDICPLRIKIIYKLKKKRFMKLFISIMFGPQTKFKWKTLKTWVCMTAWVNTSNDVLFQDCRCFVSRHNTWVLAIASVATRFGPNLWVRLEVLSLTCLINLQCQPITWNRDRFLFGRLKCKKVLKKCWIRFSNCFSSSSVLRIHCVDIIILLL